MRQKKFLFFIISIALALIVISGLLVYRFRNHSLITSLTDTHWGFITINKLAKITDIPFLFYSFKNNPLTTYQLFIKGNDLEALNQSVPRNPDIASLMAGFNLSVPAVFIDETGMEHNVKVRYRGNHVVHWGYPKKSWRIRFNKDDLYKGLRSIDLIIPEDRGLVLEHLANFRAKKLSLPYPDSWFANLKINQKSQGVYYVTEKIDEKFISKRALTGTLFGEQDYKDEYANIFDGPQFWRTYPEDPHHPDFKYLKQLLSLINDSSATTDQIMELVDLDSFINWQVHGLLMASFTQNVHRNNRLFYNHQINKFQLIPWDVGQRHDVYEELDRLYNPLADKLLSDQSVRHLRNQRLREYLQNPDNLSQDLEFFETSINQLFVPLMQDSVKFYANLKHLKDIKIYRTWMHSHFDNLLTLLDQS